VIAGPTVAFLVPGGQAVVAPGIGAAGFSGRNFIQGRKPPPVPVFSKIRGLAAPSAEALRYFHEGAAFRGSNRRFVYGPTARSDPAVHDLLTRSCRADSSQKDESSARSLLSWGRCERSNLILIGFARNRRSRLAEHSMGCRRCPVQAQQCGTADRGSVGIIQFYHPRPVGAVSSRVAQKGRFGTSMRRGLGVSAESSRRPGPLILAGKGTPWAPAKAAPGSFSTPPGVFGDPGAEMRSLRRRAGERRPSRSQASRFA